MSEQLKPCPACDKGWVHLDGGHECTLCNGLGTTLLTTEDKLRAENERLKADNVRLDVENQEIDAAKIRLNAKLEAAKVALREIKSGVQTNCTMGGYYSCGADCQDIASDCLEELK